MDLNKLTDVGNEKNIFSEAIKRCAWKNVCDLMSKESFSLDSLNFRQARSLLRFSVKFNNLAIFQKLINENNHSKSFSKSLLWTAVRAGHTEIASELVRLGADLNRRHRGWTVLQKLAVKSNKPKNVQLAILVMDHGADINALQARHYKCAFYYAVRRGCAELVEEFLKRKAHIRNYMIQKIYRTYILNIDVYYTALSTFIDEEIKHKRFVSLLWDLAKLNVDRRMSDEKFEEVLGLVSDDELYKNSRMLHNLIQRNFTLAYLLIERGVDCDFEESNIQSLLDVAVSREQTHISEWLIVKKGANVNVPCKRWDTYPLHTACFRPSENNVKLLLEHGADINLENEHGWTCHFYIKDDKIGRLIIKQVALLVCKGNFVDKRYFEKINQVPNVEKLYDNHLNELLKLKSSYIFSNIPLFSILTDVKLTSFLLRNPMARKNYEDIDAKISFPLYYEDIDAAYKKALHRKNALIDQEDAFYETASNILPYLVVEKIMLYFYLDAGL